MIRIGVLLVKRIFKFITLLIAICIITFMLIEFSPIDPITAYTGANTKISAAQRALISQNWGLDKTPIERFVHWFSSMIQGDFGVSMIYRRPVLEVIGEKFMSSLALMSIAWILSGLVGFMLGIIAGIQEGKWLDKLIKTYCHLIIATPAFWLGMLAIIVFSVQLGWFPIALSVPVGVLAENVRFVDRVRHLILPAITLSVTGSANICLHTREKVSSIMKEDFILFARARGKKLSYITIHHVLRNVSIPAMTLQFLSFSELFGGAVFIEQVFSYPGLGQAIVQSGLRGDMPLLMGIVIISLIFVHSGNLVGDIFTKVLDPRLRRNSGTNEK